MKKDKSKKRRRRPELPTDAKKNDGKPVQPDVRNRNGKPADRKPNDEARKPQIKIGFSITPSFTVAVSALNPTEVLAKLSKEVPIRDIKRLKSGETSFTADKKYEQKTFAILRETCYNYRVTARSGGKSALKAVLARSGIAVALIIFITLYALSFGYVWRVEISGNSRIPEKAFSDALAAAGVGRGTAKSNLNCDALSRSLESIDGVLECTVSVSGITLSVEVTERTEFVPPDVSTERSDVTSAYDARVTRVNASRGTVKVKPGDVVAKGSTLIEGVIYDTALGEPMYETKAKGSVFGEVTLKETRVFSLTRTTYERTGRTKKTTALSLFGLKWGSKKKHGFETFESATSADKLSPIPVSVLRTVYYETVAVTETRTAEEWARLYGEEAAELLRLRFDGAEAKLSGALKDLGAGVYRLDVYATAEIAIGAA